MHIIHWCIFAVAVTMGDFELVPFCVAGGAFAYILIVAMPFSCAAATFLLIV